MKVIGNLVALLQEAGIREEEFPKRKNRQQIAGILLADPETLFVTSFSLRGGALIRVRLHKGRARDAEIVSCGLGHPNGLAFDPIRKILYVSDEGGFIALRKSPVYRIIFENNDFRRGREKKREVAAVCIMPNGLALSPDGQSLYVAETGRFFALLPGAVHKFDLCKPRVASRRQRIGGWPDGLALSPDGRHLLLVTQYNGKAHWMDATTLRILRSGTLQGAKRINPASPGIAGSQVYVSSYWDLRLLTLPVFLINYPTLYHHEIYRFPLAQFPP